MSKNRQDCDCNPLAEKLGDMVKDLWCEIMDTSGMIELSRPCGIEREESKDERSFRASTNEECCFGDADLFAPKLVIDLRNPIPQQVARWLRSIASDLTEAADRVELIEDGRDFRAIRQMVK